MRLQKFVLGLLTWLPAVIAITQSSIPGPTPTPPPPSPRPIPCITRTPPYTTLEDLVECFDGYTVQEADYTQSAYDAAQPQGSLVIGGTINGQHVSWMNAVSSLLAVNGNCGSVVLPSDISDIYRVDLFTEAGGKSFCILSERSFTPISQYPWVPFGYNKRGWGLMVVPATNAAVLRYLHFSAPHPGTGPGADPATPKYAAAAFKNTGAKSLYVAGRNRNAFDYDVANTNSQACVGGPEHYSKTDCAHDVYQPFFWAQTRIKSWQDAHGCDTHKCAYIQIHRKDTCAAVDAYLSTGLGTGTDSINWYNNNDSPVKRIRTEMRTVFPGKTISIPSDTSCPTLTATDNVFGRLLNGRPISDVCNTQAFASTATGQFVHIEQTDGMLVSSNYANFAIAVNRAIRTIV